MSRYTKQQELTSEGTIVQHAITGRNHLLNSKTAATPEARAALVEKAILNFTVIIGTILALIPDTIEEMQEEEQAANP